MFLVSKSNLFDVYFTRMWISSLVPLFTCAHKGQDVIRVRSDCAKTQAKLNISTRASEKRTLFLKQRPYVNSLWTTLDRILYTACFNLIFRFMFEAHHKQAGLRTYMSIEGRLLSMSFLMISEPPPTSILPFYY